MLQPDSEFASKHVVIKLACAFAMLFLFSMWTNVASAERVTIDITQPSFERMPIAIPDFKYLTQEQRTCRSTGFFGNFPTP
jgi:hypothetical protein